MKAIHAVNAVLWQPGEQIEKSKQTNRLTDYYNPWPRLGLGLTTHTLVLFSPFLGNLL